MPARDEFFGKMDDITGSATSGAAITPSDSNDLTHVTRAIWVGGDGNITFTMSGGMNVTLTGVKAGSLLPIRAKRVLSTGTTATGIVGLW